MLGSITDNPEAPGSGDIVNGDINKDDTGTSGSRRKPETAIRAKDSNLQKPISVMMEIILREIAYVNKINRQKRV